MTGTLVNCGLPVSGINQSLQHERHGRSLRIATSRSRSTTRLRPSRNIGKCCGPGSRIGFPGPNSASCPATSPPKILNFGLPSPIDVQVSGRDLNDNFAYATKLTARMRRSPAAPTCASSRSWASRRCCCLAANLRARDRPDRIRHRRQRCSSTLSGSGQVAPTYWLDPTTGISHLVNIQTPQDQLTSVNDLRDRPGRQGQRQSDQRPAGDRRRPVRDHQTGTPGVVSHNDIMPVIDIYANVEGRDLGAVSGAVASAIINETCDPDLPRGATVTLQRPSDDDELRLRPAARRTRPCRSLLIYLVIVVNFQSWLDPFIVISALPAALAGDRRGACS